MKQNNKPEQPLPKFMNVFGDPEKLQPKRFKFGMGSLFLCLVLASLSFLNSTNKNRYYFEEDHSRFSLLRTIENWIFMVDDEEIERLQKISKQLDYDKYSNMQMKSLEKRIERQLGREFGNKSDQRQLEIDRKENI